MLPPVAWRHRVSVVPRVCTRRRRRSSHPSLSHAACSPAARHAALVIKFDVFPPFLSFSRLPFLSLSRLAECAATTVRCRIVCTCVCDLTASLPHVLSLSLSFSAITVSSSAIFVFYGRTDGTPATAPVTRGTSARLCEPGESQKLHNIVSARSNARHGRQSASPSRSPPRAPQNRSAIEW